MILKFQSRYIYNLYVIFPKVIHNFNALKRFIIKYLQPVFYNSLLIGLLLLILFHSEFHLIMFEGLEVKYKREIRKMIKSGIPEENLITFTFSKNILEEEIKDFKWIKDWEFRYKGEMYDIIKTEYKGDSIVYHVFHDLKESALFSNLQKHFIDYFSSNREKGKELLSVTQNYSKYYLYPFTENFLIAKSEEQQYNSQKTQNIIYLASIVFDPPPEV